MILLPVVDTFIINVILTVILIDKENTHIML